MILWFYAPHGYDPNHMKRATDEIDWLPLIEIQPAAGLIPGSLRMQARLLNAQPRETLFRIGDPVKHIFLVISGEARLIRLDRKGGEPCNRAIRGMALFRENSQFGELGEELAVATEPHWAKPK